MRKINIKFKVEMMVCFSILLISEKFGTTATLNLEYPVEITPAFIVGDNAIIADESL